MKLRTNKNSIRLRLSQSEVTKFKEFGLVNETIAFSNLACHNLQYSLIQAKHEVVTVNYINNHIRIYVPETTARHWCSSDDVGFEANIPLSESENLYILVEKDFQCLQQRKNEDESDNFPNPNLQSC